MDEQLDLERRIARIEDRQEIADLAQRYCIAIDDRDYAAMAAMYTADCTLTMPAGTVTGPIDVVAALRGSRDRYGPTIHSAHGHVITLASENSARGTVLAHAELSMDGVTVISAMRYQDEYRRTDGAWRFQSRTIEWVYLTPWADAQSALTADLRVRWPGKSPNAADLPPVS